MKPWKRCWVNLRNKVFRFQSLQQLRQSEGGIVHHEWRFEEEVADLHYRVEAAYQYAAHGKQRWRVGSEGHETAARFERIVNPMQKDILFSWNYMAQRTEAGDDIEFSSERHLHDILLDELDLRRAATVRQLLPRLRKHSRAEVDSHQSPFADRM